MESVYACFKAGLVPVNTNYRYKADELVYLWENADAEAVVFHAAFADVVAEVRPRVPKVRAWIWTDDGSGATCPQWATRYDEIVAVPERRCLPAWGRSADDLYLLYTGGTTGLPKGVMWRQEDLFHLINQGDLTKAREVVDAPGPVVLPACPLMHGTASFAAFGGLCAGGSLVTLVNRQFDAVCLLDAIERERAALTVIVGDAFAAPVVSALDAEPARWDISSLQVIISSGAMWSQASKSGLSRHNERMILIDTLGSSEAAGIAQSIAYGGSSVPTARFQLSANARVLSEDGREIQQGSGETGMLAITGSIPVGYYKDAEKTAATFRTVGTKRYSIPGDYATVDADGYVTLLGRGSASINTGGEKVYAEEVEEALKDGPGVKDAIVVGVPDDRLGESVCAVVVADQCDEAGLRRHVASRLAGYKVPKRIFSVPTLERAPNGKVDYRRWKSLAAEMAAPAATVGNAQERPSAPVTAEGVK